MLALSLFRRELPPLSGSRVTLRMPRASDYREWAALRGESRGFLEPWEPRWSADELERSGWQQRLTRYREEFDRGTGVAFLIFGRQSPTLLGGISLGNIRHGVSLSGHVGYWIGERHAGQGLMGEALGLVCDYAFDRVRLHRIEAACIPGNIRSVRVLEKAGFQREGLLRSFLKINGAWQDHLLYSLIAEDRRTGKRTDLG